MQDKIFKVFVAAGGAVEVGVMPDTFALASGTTIPAVLVGERGRGRELGVLPVSGVGPFPCPHQGREIEWSRCPKCGQWCEPGEDSLRYIHPPKGEYVERLAAARIGRTRRGAPKLLAADPAEATDEAAIIIMKTPIGYRGGNSHTGDCTGWECPKCGQSGGPPAGRTCPECGADYWDGYRRTFAPFPGQILVAGRIAQGAAGRMGAGDQYVVLMPKGAIWRTGYSGRLYGGPSEHYYLFDGGRVLAATAKERDVADLF